MRSSTGGCVERRREPSPFAKSRWAASGVCAAPRRDPCAAILESAPARPPGLRVNCTAAASARYSRSRETARRMSRAKKAPTDPAAKSTSPAARTTPPPPRLEPIRTRPEPRRSVRPTSARTVSPPTAAMSCRLSRASAFSTCESSWAITPCSSSRESASSAPRVTATTARSDANPAANAFTPGSSSSTQMPGTGRPAAMAISSTTFTSRFRSGRSVRRSTGTPPSMLATAAPPPAASRAAVPGGAEPGDRGHASRDADEERRPRGGRARRRRAPRRRAPARARRGRPRSSRARRARTGPRARPCAGAPPPGRRRSPGWPGPPLTARAA